MQLLLHAPEKEVSLSQHYREALGKAVELSIVSAYLTEWDASLRLNQACCRFRMIIGKDFGITRKTACLSVMSWLPPKFKANFLVADGIGGFHPKAVFWKEADSKTYAIVGSSNLTAAAFATNYEANIYCPISLSDYHKALVWVAEIAKSSVPVSSDWLEQYNEVSRLSEKDFKTTRKISPDDTVVSLNLPRPKGMNKEIRKRRQQLAEFSKNKSGLLRLFRRCATKAITSEQFYDQLPNHWGGAVGGRLQGSGWERQGKGSDFQILAESFAKILDANDTDRDDVVVDEVDFLAKNDVPARGAFLSEMLCLNFPDLYPIRNKPVKEYLKAVSFRAPRGVTEGAKYRDLAHKLRVSLERNPNHPARNLAELDGIIWLAYGN